jgi:hypothetical protein
VQRQWRSSEPGPAAPALLPLGWQAAEAAARKREWKLLSLEVRDAGEIEGALPFATLSVSFRSHAPILAS